MITFFVPIFIPIYVFCKEHFFGILLQNEVTLNFSFFVPWRFGRFVAKFLKWMISASLNQIIQSFCLNFRNVWVYDANFFTQQESPFISWSSLIHHCAACYYWFHFFFILFFLVWHPCHNQNIASNSVVLCSESILFLASDNLLLDGAFLNNLGMHRFSLNTSLLVSRAVG